MKKSILILASLLVCLSSFAQLNGDGYYRIRNLGSQRYVIVTDNKGSVSISSTSADLGAIKLLKNFSNVVSDPGSIIYVNEVNGQYRFEAQGTDTHKIIGYDLKLKKSSNGSYLAYQEEAMLRKFLCDGRKEDTEEGSMSTISDNTTHRNWEILPLSSSGDNYFGVTSEYVYNDSYYSTIYASFPFTFASSGMAAYYVNKVENGIAVFAEVANNTVPASMPVIIKTTSSDPSANRLNIGANMATKPSDNKLGGVYFHNTSKKHNNLTPYNPETMRVLGITSTGKLGFVKASIDYLPANKAYLNVLAGSPDELLLMTQSEYDVYMNATFEVKVTSGTGGTVSGAGSYKRFAQVDLTAIPSDGYHFEKWSDGTVANPYSFKVTDNVSLNAIFAPNAYKLTYMLNGVEHSTFTCLYGEQIKVLPNLEKEGYTFSGWSEIPATMPARDVTVNGSLFPNIYQVTYMVDGEVYKIDSVACDALFKAEPLPTKEGYNFVGWENVPLTMPAGDVVLSGTFVVNKDNKYNLIYMIDGQVYASETLEYGTLIILKEVPVKEGYIFSGWSEAPETMPAHDVVITAVFTVDGIEEVLADCLVDVYTLQGMRVKVQVPMSDLQHELPAGIYIVNGRKLIIR